MLQQPPQGRQIGVVLCRRPADGWNCGNRKQRMYRKQQCLSQEQFIEVIPTKREEKGWAIVFKSWSSFSCPRGSGQLFKKYNIQKHILTQTHTKTSQLLTEKVKTKALQYYYFFFWQSLIRDFTEPQSCLKYISLLSPL